MYVLTHSARNRFWECAIPEADKKPCPLIAAGPSITVIQELTARVKPAQHLVMNRQYWQIMADSGYLNLIGNAR